MPAGTAAGAGAGATHGAVSVAAAGPGVGANRLQAQQAVSLLRGDRWTCSVGTASCAAGCRAGPARTASQRRHARAVSTVSSSMQRQVLPHGSACPAAVCQEHALASRAWGRASELACRKRLERLKVSSRALARGPGPQGQAQKRLERKQGLELVQIGQAAPALAPGGDQLHIQLPSAGGLGLVA